MSKHMQQRPQKNLTNRVLWSVAGSCVAVACALGITQVAGSGVANELASNVTAEQIDARIDDVRERVRAAQVVPEVKDRVETVDATTAELKESSGQSGEESGNGGAPDYEPNVAPEQEQPEWKGETETFTMPEGADYVPEVALIQVDPEASPEDVSAVLAMADGVVERELTAEDLTKGYVEVELEQGVEVEDAVNELMACGSDVVEGAQPDYVYYCLNEYGAADLRMATEPLFLTGQETRELKAQQAEGDSTAASDTVSAAAEQVAPSAPTSEASISPTSSSEAEGTTTEVASPSSADGAETVSVRPEEAASTESATSADEQAKGSSAEQNAATSSATEPTNTEQVSSVDADASPTESPSGSSSAEAASTATSSSADASKTDSASDETKAEADKAESEEIEEQKTEEDDALHEQATVYVKDAKVGQQWGLTSIKAFEAWALAQCNHKVTVAVLDGGFDLNHEDLKANMLSDYAYNAATQQRGASYVTPDDALRNHATHVSGIIAGTANNNIGVAGVSYNAYILPIKVFKGNSASTSSVAEAYDYLMNHVPASYNVRVVNLSVGGRISTLSTNDKLVLERIKEAHNKRNIVTVAAAGNSTIATPPYAIYPGDYAPVVSVINLQQSGNSVSRSSTSNYNLGTSDRKNISAPGTSIYSTFPYTNQYNNMSGTSMAAPCVAGVLALEFAANNNLTADNAVKYLYETATDLGDKGWDVQYGYGEVNAAAAVAKARANSGSSVKTDIAGASIGVNPSSATYTGSAIEPHITVTSGGATLQQGTDYRLSFANNVKVGTATVTITGIGNYTGTTTATFTITKAPTDWKRLWGAEALDTMSVIVNEGGFATGGTVVLATSAGYWDALTAAGLAGLSGAPVLMTETHSLSPQTRDQLARLRPSTILVCGGTSVIKDNVVSDAQSAAGAGTVRRIWGETAIDTANEIFLQAPGLTGKGWGSVGFVCTAAGYWDALSAAPISYAKQMPIFLSNIGSIEGSTINAMKAGGVTQVYLVGGTSVLTQNVEAQLSSNGIAVLGRIWGEEAVDTSWRVADYGVSLGMSSNYMGVATDAGYWDALSGAALCGKKNAVLVLVNGASASSISSFVKPHKDDIATGYVFGGTSVIRDATFNALVAATR